MDKSYYGQVIWIIGASSGIGRALAGELSARGAVLALSARNQDALEHLKSELGNRHKIFTLDGVDTQKTCQTAQAIQDDFGRIDRVIFLAAAYEPMKTENLDMDAVKNMINVNLMGAFNVVHAVLPILKNQKTKGQLALCGSIAGYMGLPGGQPYSATKAGIISLAESLHGEWGDRVDIKLISPGFVRTSLTDKNDFKMPLIMEPEQAAREIARGLLARRFEVHFPKKFTVFLKFMASMPYALSLGLARKIKT